MNTGKSLLNINEASKLCGLSPSVLRIWELRYGWPNPKRQPNGYRVYSLGQVQELKRMAELVRSGTPVSSLIVEGMPRWPESHAPGYGPKSLPQTRALPLPDNRNAQELRDVIVEALETRRGAMVRELIQRAIVTIRPVDEPGTVFAPVLIGMAELQQTYRELRDADGVHQLIVERGRQLLRMLRQPAQAELWVVPATTFDHALAVTVALVCSQRGVRAEPWLQGGLPPEGAILSVSDGDFPDAEKLGDRHIADLSSLGGEGVVSVAELLRGSWSPTVEAAIAMPAEAR